VIFRARVNCCLLAPRSGDVCGPLLRLRATACELHPPRHTAEVIRSIIAHVTLAYTRCLGCRACERGSEGVKKRHRGDSASLVCISIVLVGIKSIGVDGDSVYLHNHRVITYLFVLSRHVFLRKGYSENSLNGSFASPAVGSARFGTSSKFWNLFQKSGTGFQIQIFEPPLTPPHRPWHACAHPGHWPRLQQIVPVALHIIS